MSLACLLCSPSFQHGVSEERKSVAGVWSFTAGVKPDAAAPAATTFTLADFALNLAAGSGDAIRPATLSIEVLTADGRSLGAWSGLPLEPAHKTAGVPDGIFDLFSLSGPSSAGLPIVLLAVIRTQIGYIFGAPNTSLDGRTVHHVTGARASE